MPKLCKKKNERLRNGSPATLIAHEGETIADFPEAGVARVRNVVSMFARWQSKTLSADYSTLSLMYIYAFQGVVALRIQSEGVFL